MNRRHEWFETFDEGLWLKGDEGADRDAAFVGKILRLGRGSRVLDVPCGAGRIAVHLARSGCDVTGVDLTRGFIERARRRFKTERLKGVFLEGDMRELGFDGEFDAVYNWGGSFGYFSEAENAEVLRRFARALKPGGRLLVDQPNREFLLRHWLPSIPANHARMKNTWDSASQRSRSEWIIAGGGRKAISRSVIRLYTLAQLRRLFARAGLLVEAVYGDLDARAYRRGSRRIYVVGRKARER